jgi:uncharacterized protein (TIGR02996 family)
MSTTHEGLLRAILVDPSDDSQRLIYADWLEDHDQSHRAELIRVQLTRARLPGGCRNALGELAGFPVVPHDCPCRPCVLDCRGKELLDGSAEKEASPGSYHFTNRFLWSGFTIEQYLEIFCLFRRGFIEESHCHCRVWEAHGPAVVRLQPVQCLELTDAVPEETSPRSERWLVPDWRSWPWDVHTAVADARLAKVLHNRSALNWARVQAGLPPLKD